MTHIKRLVIGLLASGVVALLYAFPLVFYGLVAVAVVYSVGWFFHAMWSDLHHECEKDPLCDDDYCRL